MAADQHDYLCPTGKQPTAPSARECRDCALIAAARRSERWVTLHLAVAAIEQPYRGKTPTLGVQKAISAVRSVGDDL